MVDLEIVPRVWTSSGRIVSPLWERRVLAEDSVQYLKDVLRSYGVVMLTDLEGYKRNRPDVDLLKAVEGERVWSDAGPRYSENVIDLFVAGADKVVMDATMIASFQELYDAVEMSEDILFKLDVEMETFWSVTGRISPLEYLDRAVDAGVDGVIYVTHSGQHPEMESILRLTERGAKVYLGMVDMDRVSDFKEMGLKGVLVYQEKII